MKIGVSHRSVMYFNLKVIVPVAHVKASDVHDPNLRDLCNHHCPNLYENAYSYVHAPSTLIVLPRNDHGGDDGHRNL